MNPNIDIASILKRTRKKRKIKQHVVAARIGMKRGTYGAYEQERATPDINGLIKIAIAFGYNSLDDFLFKGRSETTRLPIVKAYYKASEEQRKIVDLILKIK